MSIRVPILILLVEHGYQCVMYTEHNVASTQSRQGMRQIFNGKPLVVLPRLDIICIVVGLPQRMPHRVGFVPGVTIASTSGYRHNYSNKISIES